MSPTVIVLGVDSPIGLAVVRDLGRHGARVIGIGWTRRAVGLHSRHCAVPVLRARGEAAVVDQLRRLAQRHGARFLLVVGESDVDLVNRNREVIETFLKPLVPTAEAMARVVNKDVAQEIARSVGIRVPRTVEIGHEDEIAQMIGALDYPVAVKWANPHEVYDALEANGIALEKCEYARGAAELRAILDKYRPVGRFPLVQEYCAGHGLGQFFLVHDGEVKAEFQHERLHEIPPEGGASTLCRSLPLHLHAECRARSRALLQALGWDGIAMVEYRYDPAARTYAFMEVNGRFWGSFPLAVACGVPFAWGLVQCCGLGREIEPTRPAAGRLGRYVIPEVKRLHQILFRPGSIADPMKTFSRWREALAFVALYLDPRVRYFIFQWTDPGPFLADTWYALKSALAR